MRIQFWFITILFGALPFSNAITQMNTGQWINPTPNSPGAQIGSGPSSGGINWGQVSNVTRGEGRYVTEVWLDLRLMNSTEAESDSAFYLGFPTLDRRHQYRYLTRRRDGGLKLRFTPALGERRIVSHWRMQGRAGDDDCALTDCDLPSIPIADMEPVEIHTESPGCSQNNPLGVERAVVTYGLNNGELRRVELNNLWIPCVEFPTDRPAEKIKKVTVTIGWNGQRTSLGRRVKAKLVLGNGVELPLTTQNPGSSGTILETLSYEFKQTYGEYTRWLDGTSDSFFWNAAELGCRADRNWREGSVEQCQESVLRSRPNRVGRWSTMLELYCEYYYDTRCRYYPTPHAENVDLDDIKIEVSIDNHGWYGWNEDLAFAPVFIDDIDLEFEKFNGERFSADYTAGYSIPCSNASRCEIAADPLEIWVGQDTTVSWRFAGMPDLVTHNLNLICPGYSGRWPDREDAELPREGEAQCYGITTPLGYSYDIRVTWACPEVAPNARRIGLHYRDANTTHHCRTESISSRGNLRIEDSEGCDYNLDGYDEQHPMNVGTTTWNNYISRFGVVTDQWLDVTPQYRSYQSRNALKRLLTAIHFLKDRRWEDYSRDIQEGERIRNDWFYDFAGTEIDDLEPWGGCDPGFHGRYTGLGYVDIAKKLVFEDPPVARAATIFHEGWHGASWERHVDCSDGGFAWMGRCDESWGSNGAYRASVVFYSWIYGECANCSPLIREYARSKGNLILDGSFYEDPDFRL